jgi:hypothetical protein
MVAGSNPARGASKFSDLLPFLAAPNFSRVCTVSANRLRQTDVSGEIMGELTELERVLLAACKVALRQLEYDGDDKTGISRRRLGRTDKGDRCVTPLLAAVRGKPYAGSAPDGDWPRRLKLGRRPS